MYNNIYKYLEKKIIQFIKKKKIIKVKNLISLKR